jgi:hypothetical protein
VFSDAVTVSASASRPAASRAFPIVPDVKEGATMRFAYLPEKGTTLAAGSKEPGVFEGKGFADAVCDLAGTQAAFRGAENRDAGLKQEAVLRSL